jgi:hypothetical protein
MLNQFKEGKILIQKAIQIYPEEKKFYFYFSICNENLNLLDEALENIE